MKLSRRILIFVISALVALPSSAFLFEQNVYAAQQEKASVRLDILRDNEPKLLQFAVIVDKKANELQKANAEIEAIKQSRLALSQEVANLKSQLEGITQQVADKQVRVEAERKRVEELKNMFVHIARYADNAAGNLYAAGNCTWYAKDRRSDLPNDLGDANAWYANAQARGWNVGSTPKKGAVATTTSGWAGHVAYVEGVSLDGLHVTISEMNYGGLYRMNTRTVFYTEFQYIYELG